MHTVVFGLSLTQRQVAQPVDRCPRAPHVKLQQVPLSETIVPRAIVPMDVSRCAQSTWFIRVGIFFRSFRRETPNHWRAIAVLLTLLGGSRRVELPYAVVERWPWRLGGRVAVGRVARWLCTGLPSSLRGGDRNQYWLDGLRTLVNRHARASFC